MHTHEELEAIFYADEEVLSVIDINVKLSFQSIMNMDASFDANLIILTVPVCLVSNWYTVPAVWIHSSKLGTDATNDTLGEYMWLLKKIY